MFVYDRFARAGGGKYGNKYRPPVDRIWPDTNGTNETPEIIFRWVTNL